MSNRKIERRDREAKRVERQYMRGTVASDVFYDCELEYLESEEEQSPRIIRASGGLFTCDPWIGFDENRDHD
ncbi:hypothetical protein EBR66_01415 [bacterium]|nr:hypothetical protein [bacterium]